MDALLRADIVPSGYMPAAALPYLSLWLGNAAIVLFILLLLTLLGGMLYLILKQLQDWKRNAAIGTWLLISISQVFALANPFGLLPVSGYGIAFIGSGEVGTLVLVLLFFSSLITVRRNG
jgi:hypothetical protein